MYTLDSVSLTDENSYTFVNVSPMCHSDAVQISPHQIICLCLFFFFFLTYLILCSLKGPFHLHSHLVLLKRDFFYNQKQQIFHSKVTAHLCDGLMPFVVFFFPKLYLNTEKLIKRRMDYFVKETTQNIDDFPSVAEWSVRALSFFKLTYLLGFCWLTFLLRGQIFYPLRFQMLSLIEHRWIAGKYR